MKEGTYPAKVCDYGIGETKTGKPFVGLQFEVENEGRINTRLFLTEKALDRTIKTLKRLGLSGDDLMVLVNGPEGKGLDMNREVEIVVEMEASDDGKEYPRVKWINSYGSLNTVSTSKAIEIVKNLKNGGDNLLQNSTLTVDDIPF